MSSPVRRSLENTIVVVTGGASGIGRALALGAAARGASVAIADVELDRAQAVASEILEAGGRAEIYRCDVADDADVNKLAEAVRADFGGANWIFNNAGVVSGGTLESSSFADATWMLSVNVLGVLNGVKAFLPLLRHARSLGQRAGIVNTGSENSLGVPPLGPSSVYTATKHAVLGLTDALRRDLQGTGIFVSVLCPGLVNTEVFDARRNRPAAYGGPLRAASEHAQHARALMAERGQDPALTAELCFEGVERGDFLIITEPKVRGFAATRLQEIETAMFRIEQRLH